MYYLGTHSFASLGVSAATLTSYASATDTLVISLAEAIDATSHFSPWEMITLYDDSSPIWVGWLDTRALTATGANQATSLTLRGAGRWLDIFMYQQSRAIGTIAQTYDDLGSVVLGLGYDSETGDPQKISANEQAADLAAQLAANLPAYPANGGVTLRPMSGGAYLPALKLPLMPKTNASLGTCLGTLLAWFPRICWRTAPIVNLPLDTNRPALELIDTDSQPTITLPTTDGISNLQITPRYDLQLSRTKITYARRAADQGGIFGTTTDTATTANGSPHRLDYTIDLEPGEEIPSPGLAAEYQLWAGRLLWDINLTLTGLHWDLLPGHRIALTAPLPTTARIAVPPVIQTLTRDLMAGTIQVTAGTRGQLGLDQRIQLPRKHPRSAASGIGEQAFDGGDSDTEKKTESGQLTVDFTDPPTGLTLDTSSIGWLTTTATGIGPGDSTAIPGSYTIQGIPIIDDDGYLWSAPPAYAEASPIGSTPAWLTYVPASRLQLLHSDGRRIDIDTAGLPAGMSATFREITICTDAGEATAYVLMSDPQTIA